MVKFLGMMVGAGFVGNLLVCSIISLIEIIGK